MTMMFGGDVEAAETTAAAEWIGASCRGEPGTVGALVPNDDESVLRVAAPASGPEDWWPRYRDVFEAIASVGERHTARPERAWYAVWEGHSYDDVTTSIARPPRWFVATDVDFWSLDVGGDRPFTGEVSDNVPTSSHRVPWGELLEIED